MPRDHVADGRRQEAEEEARSPGGATREIPRAGEMERRRRPFVQPEAMYSPANVDAVPVRIPYGCARTGSVRVRGKHRLDLILRKGSHERITKDDAARSSDPVKAAFAFRVFCSD